MITGHRGMINLMNNMMHGVKNVSDELYTIKQLAGATATDRQRIYRWIEREHIETANHAAKGETRLYSADVLQAAIDKFTPDYDTDTTDTSDEQHDKSDEQGDTNDEQSDNELITALREQVADLKDQRRDYREQLADANRRLDGALNLVATLQGRLLNAPATDQHEDELNVAASDKTHQEPIAVHGWLWRMFH